jgi:hypothetical protein
VTKNGLQDKRIFSPKISENYKKNVILTSAPLGKDKKCSTLMDFAVSFRNAILSAFSGLRDQLRGVFLKNFRAYGKSWRLREKLAPTGKVGA